MATVGVNGLSRFHAIPDSDRRSDIISYWFSLPYESSILL